MLDATLGVDDAAAAIGADDASANRLISMSPWDTEGGETATTGDGVGGAFVAAASTRCSGSPGGGAKVSTARGVGAATGVSSAAPAGPPASAGIAVFSLQF